MKALFSFMIFSPLFCGGCMWIHPPGAHLTRAAVHSIAEHRASADGIDLSRFHKERTLFVPDKSCWYVVFQENGMLLLAGEEFTVFVHDESGAVRLIPEAGLRTTVRERKLARMLEDLE